MRETTARTETLVGYYRSINRVGRALGYNWNDLAEIGFDDPREVLALNNELVACGVLRRVSHGPRTFGNTSLYLNA